MARQDGWAAAQAGWRGDSGGGGETRGGGGAETEPGGQEMRKDGDTVEGTKKWGESDDEGRGGRMRDRGSLVSPEMKSQHAGAHMR